MKIVKILILFFLSSVCFSIIGQTGSRVKIVTYNLLNYPNAYSTRNPNFKKVLDEIDPDILVVQEITSQFGVDEFLVGVLGAEYKAGLFINGDDTDNAIFYKDSLFTFINHIPITSSQLTRNISEFTMANNFSNDTLLIYSVHLKASEEDSVIRRNEVSVLRTVTDNLPVGTKFIVLGDFNIYRASETAYLNLVNKSSSGYVIDPLIAGNWHNNNAYAILHTQSTCGLFSGCPNGGSGGGLDDRFDMILISQSIYDSSGIYLIANSNKAYGNDGFHFNKSINVPPFTSITQEIANALYNASDHLPVVAEFQFGDVNSVVPIDPSNLTFNLYQNYPNPFNPVTTIKFEVPQTTNVKLVLYDLLGREIRILYDGEAKAGITEISVSAEGLNSGIYFYRLSTVNHSSSKKLIVLK
jgi:endonuclease/exonuclease/phosphatase family metal-dependent hydrolase